jgi:hypothetical protein
MMTFRQPDTKENAMEISVKGFSEDEVALLRSVILTLRNLRYGSVSLTVHDGRLVEIQKVEKIRMNGTQAVI